MNGQVNIACGFIERHDDDSESRRAGRGFYERKWGVMFILRPRWQIDCFVFRGIVTASTLALGTLVYGKSIIHQLMTQCYPRALNTYSSTKQMILIFESWRKVNGMRSFPLYHKFEAEWVDNGWWTGKLIFRVLHYRLSTPGLILPNHSGKHIGVYQRWRQVWSWVSSYEIESKYDISQLWLIGWESHREGAKVLESAMVGDWIRPCLIYISNNMYNSPGSNYLE